MQALPARPCRPSAVYRMRWTASIRSEACGDSRVQLYGRMSILAEKFTDRRPDCITGMAQTKRYKMLTIELVPRGIWYKNLRSMLSHSNWDKLRKEVYKKANYRCEICGGRGDKWPVECHEIWNYDDNVHIQTLTGLIALCPLCHSVKHIGLSQIHGKYESARNHLMKVNEWNIEIANAYIVKAFAIWQRRSQHRWTCNLDWLNRKEKKSDG